MRCFEILTYSIQQFYVIKSFKIKDGFKLMKKVAILLLLCCPFGEVYSGIILNMYITHRKGLDKGLDLVSELHAKRAAFKGEKLHLALRDGPSIEIMANFFDDFSEHGPSERIEINVEVLSGTGIRVKSLKEKKIVIPIGDQGFFQFQENETQLVDVVVSPEVY